MAKLTRIFIATILSLIASFAIAAQTNSSLIVSVSDPNGNLVAGAPVVLSTVSGFKQNAVTSDLGVSAYRGLESGKYELTVTVDGFKPYKNVAIELKPNETKRLDVILELAAIESKVDVTQTDAVDPNTSDSRDLKKEEIETLPDNPDELKRVLQALAGPTLTGEEMPISVNGIPGANLPNKENIKLVRINRNVFSSQYEYSWGGGIEIYTDSEVKRITGYVGANFSDARLNATNPFIGRRVPYQSRGLNFGFTIPLGKKANISSYTYLSDAETSSVVNAVVLDQNFNPIDFRQSFDTPRSSLSQDVYLTWDPNKKHKLVAVFYAYLSKSDNTDLSGFSLESRANKNRSSNFSLGINETFIVSPDFVITTRFSGRVETNETIGNTTEAAINVSEAFLGGGSQMDQKSTNSRFELYSDTTRKFGRLNMGFGAMLRGYRIEDISRSNFGGTYTFSGRTAPVLDANFQPVLDALGNVVTTQITSLESYRRTLLLRNRGLSNAQIRTLGGGADQFTISGGLPEIEVSQLDYAFYQQNNFSLNETMGISFGLRYENQTNIENRTNFAPRFGFTWAPKAKEKQKPEWTLPRVTVGYGVFYNRFGISYAMNEAQANSPDRAFYFITDSTILDRFPAAPSISELQQGSTLRSLRLIDDELRAPFYNMFNLNVSKNLWKGTSVNVSYTRTHNSRSILTRNINAPLAAAPGSTAPPIYPSGNSRNIYETRSEGRSRSDRYSISFNLPSLIKLFGKPGNIGGWYNYTRISNDAVTGSGSPLDPYDFSREWGPGISDGQHFVFGYFQFSLPKMFSFRGDYNIRTGSRFNIITGRDTNRDGIYAERPAFASDPSKPGVIQTPFGLLDPNPAPGDILIPRNLARGSGGSEFNVYLSKAFGFNKDKANKDQPRQRLNFNISINNIFNRNNKGNPIGNMSSPNFLRTVTASNFDGDFRPASPRRMSLSTSFSF